MTKSSATMLTPADRQLLERWAATASAPPLARQLVHKRLPENVALNRLHTLERPHCFVSQVHVDPTHSYFFEHAIDHVPGMLLIEAARQFGLAVSHRFYGVDQDSAFSLSGFHVHFQRYAELHTPTFIVGEMADRTTRRGQLSATRFTGWFMHGGVEIGQMTGTWKILPDRVYRRLRTRAQAPRNPSSPLAAPSAGA